MDEAAVRELAAPSPGATAVSLAAALAGIDPSAGDARSVTVRITTSIVRWASSHGWSPRLEVSPPEMAEFGLRRGVVDVLVARGPELPPLAIEIDRGNKAWSLEKLVHLREAGHEVVWVRWQGIEPEMARVPAGLEVIVLRAGVPVVLVGARSGTGIVAPRELADGTRRMLALAFPDGLPVVLAGADEASIWARVDALGERPAAALRARFGGPGTDDDGRHSPSLAEVRASEQAIRRLRRSLEGSLAPPRPGARRGFACAAPDRCTRTGLRSVASAASHDPADPGWHIPMSRPALRTVPDAPVPAPRVERPVLWERDHDHGDPLPGLVEDILRACRGEVPTAPLIAHVLRGSSGRATRDLVVRWNLPHDGRLAASPYRDLRDAVAAILERRADGP